MDGTRSHWERRRDRGWPSRARVSLIPSGVAPTVCRGDRGAPSRDAPTAHCSRDTLLGVEAARAASTPHPGRLIIATVAGGVVRYASNSLTISKDSSSVPF